MARRNNKPALERRQAEAKERDAERATRSPMEQLKALDFRLGKNEGAKKERKRLASAASVVVEEAPKKRRKTTES